MNVIFDIAEIRLSEVHTQQICVPRWEIPVLTVLHGDNLQVKSQVIIERAVPNPRDEFERLVQRYGPKNASVPAVGAVYGQFGPGVQALRNEMRDSLTNEEATPSTYRTIEQRKADAEKAADASGQTLVQEAEALAIANAAAANGAGNGAAAVVPLGAEVPSTELAAAAAAGILDAPNPALVAAAAAAGNGAAKVEGVIPAAAAPIPAVIPAVIPAANAGAKAETGDIADLI